MISPFFWAGGYFFVFKYKTSKGGVMDALVTSLKDKLSVCIVWKADFVPLCVQIPILIAETFSLPPLNVNLNPSLQHIIIWPKAVIQPYSEWLLGTLLAWPWLLHIVFHAMSLSPCTSNLQPLLKCMAQPCHGPFSYNWWRQFYWLTAKNKKKNAGA